MATPTVTDLSGGDIPFDSSNAKRITGGSTTDRISITDFVGAVSELSYDEDTGIVTQSGTDGTIYVFGGDSETADKDCFVHFENAIFQIYSNTGTDSANLDLGNDTSKIYFNHQCDVVIGNDTGVEDGGFNGNVIIRGENYGYNFFTYVPVFARQTLVTCHSFLVMACKGNSRISVISSNTSSVLKMVFVSHSADPYGENTTLNIDSEADTNIVIYGSRAAFRDGLIPGGLTSSEATISSMVASDDKVIFLYNGLQDINGVHQINDLSLTSIAQSDQPDLVMKYVNRTPDAELNLHRYHGSRSNDKFLASNNNGHMTVNMSQDVTFKIVDELGASLDADLVVETSSISSSFTDSDGGTPTGSVTDYATETEHDDTSEATQRIIDKTYLSNRNGNENERTASDSSVVPLVRSDARYSAFSFGYEIINDVEFTLDDEATRDVVIQMVPENNLRSSTLAGISNRAFRMDDIFDMVYEWALTNKEELPFNSVSAGAINLGSRNLTLEEDTSVTEVSISDEGDIVIPSISSSLNTGTKVLEVITTGTITIPEGMTVYGRLTDTNGTTSLVTVTAEIRSDYRLLF